MLGLPFLGLKWVAGAVVGQAGVLRRVSGRGMGLQGAGVCLGVAPYFLVSYFPLASRSDYFAKKSGAQRFALLERAVARSGTQQRAVLQDKQRCTPKLARGGQHH